MPKLVHFEICADHVERTAKFYEKVFGWPIRKEEAEEYWLITPKGEEEPYITGGIMKRVSPSESVINTFEVPSVDSMVRKIVDSGGEVYEDSPIAIPGVGYMHYCGDPEGNVFGIIQYDEGA